MELCNITEREQLVGYYEEKGLTDIEAKVVHLKEAMQIRAIRYESDATPDEILEGLEESAVSGDWKYLCH